MVGRSQLVGAGGRGVADQTAPGVAPLRCDLTSCLGVRLATFGTLFCSRVSSFGLGKGGGHYVGACSRNGCRITNCLSQWEVEETDVIDGHEMSISMPSFSAVAILGSFVLEPLVVHRPGWGGCCQGSQNPSPIWRAPFSLLVQKWCDRANH